MLYSPHGFILISRVVEKSKVEVEKLKLHNLTNWNHAPSTIDAMLL